jgi:hypothetical protein
MWYVEFFEAPNSQVTPNPVRTQIWIVYSLMRFQCMDPSHVSSPATWERVLNILKPRQVTAVP